MIRMKRIAMAMSALGLVGTAAPVFAGEVEDLKAMVQKLMVRVEQLEAQKKAAAVAPAAAPVAAAPAAVPANVVTTGDLPNSIKVPGTDTSLRVYGYVQTDAVYDMRGRTSDIEGYDWANWVAAQPLNNSTDGKRRNQLYLTARTSRIGLETSTPSDMGLIKTKIEADFNSPNAYSGEGLTNSYLPRLRHAYGTVGNLLVGQTWSNFSDLDSFVDSVDFNGIGTQTFVRQPQIRYTQPFNASSSLSVAVENPESRTRDTTLSGQYAYDKTPDLTARFTTKGNWGHVSLAGVYQQYRNDLHSKGAVGLQVGGSLKLSPNDTIVAQIKGGDGIGRYMLNSYMQSAVDSGSQLDLWRAVGGHFGYTHAWSPKVRSNLIYAYTHFSGTSAMEALTSTGVATIPNHKLNEALINTFWSVAKNTEVGLEYGYGQRTTFTGEKGTMNRINATFRYNLF